MLRVAKYCTTQQGPWVRLLSISRELFTRERRTNGLVAHQPDVDCRESPEITAANTLRSKDKN
jgi:hypothetical protein